VPGAYAAHMPSTAGWETFEGRNMTDHYPAGSGRTSARRSTRLGRVHKASSLLGLRVGTRTGRFPRAPGPSGAMGMPAASPSAPSHLLQEVAYCGRHATSRERMQLRPMHKANARGFVECSYSHSVEVRGGLASVRLVSELAYQPVVRRVGRRADPIGPRASQTDAFLKGWLDYTPGALVPGTSS
jgi:hypothetical protein